MAKYIIVYKVNDLHENGGGIHAEDFEWDEEEKLHERVNQLANEYREKFSIIYAGYLTD